MMRVGFWGGFFEILGVWGVKGRGEYGEMN